MRVLVVSHLWPRSDWLHLGTFVSEQVAALIRKCEVAVAVPVDMTVRKEELTGKELISGLKRYRDRTRPELIDIEGVQINPIPFKGSLLRRTFGNLAAGNLRDALSKLDLDHYDIVHAHTVFPDGLACALWLEDRPVPLVITAHGSDVHSIPGGIQQALGPMFNRVDRLIPVSHFLGEQLVSYGADRARIMSIPNGFPGEPYKSVDAIARDPYKIAFLGRLDDVKQVDLLIKAVAECDSRITLVIAGDGSKRKEYEALVARLDLSSRVQFLGRVEREDVPAFLASAGIMCLVSRKEGWPTVIFESLACGTPVLATAVGGVPEALNDDILGITVSEQITPEELAKQIAIAIDIQWDRDKIRDHAFNYTWEKITDQLIGLYRGLSKKH